MNGKDDKDMIKTPSLYDHLKEYGQKKENPFHMPGHKRKIRPDRVPQHLPWNLDITEIDGFDNLHHAEGILKESMDLAASFYGTEKTLYSINGSTAGILSSIFAVTNPGDKILIARNSHKSVYHGVLLRQLIPVYVYPQIDRVTGIACGYSPEEIEKLLIAHPDIKAVLITSPTYEGVISDIQKIAEIAHKKEIPLIVDEAHGAHLTMQGSWYREFPQSATCLGADFVIQSLHKTLPALTQTAVLHVCPTALRRHTLFGEEASRYMGIFQTSSPSYVLMSSIDACIRYEMSEMGQKDLRDYRERLMKLRDHLRRYTQIHLLEPCLEGQRSDPSKLLLQADHFNGKQLYDLLRKTYHIQPEMHTDRYVLLLTSVFDTEEMYDCLCNACSEIERSCIPSQKAANKQYRLPKPSMIYTSSETELHEKETVRLADAEGRISAEYAYQYPPGIPLLVPGEKIEEVILQRLLCQSEMGIEIQGLRSLDASVIQVVKEEK